MQTHTGQMHACLLNSLTHILTCPCSSPAIPPLPPCLPAGAIISEMGWFNLFTRGLPLRIVMIGTLTGLQWGIYDAFKVYVGLPTTGSAAPPAEPVVVAAK